MFAGLGVENLRLSRQLPQVGWHGFRVGMADVMTMKSPSFVETGRAASRSEFGHGIGNRDSARRLALMNRIDHAQGEPLTL